MPIIDIKGYNDFAAIASMNETAHQVNFVTNPDNLMYLTCVAVTYVTEISLIVTLNNQ